MPRSCPECEQGKHANCTGWVLNDYDVEESCGCPCLQDEEIEED